MQSQWGLGLFILESLVIWSLVRNVPWASISFFFTLMQSTSANWSMNLRCGQESMFTIIFADCIFSLISINLAPSRRIEKGPTFLFLTPHFLLTACMLGTKQDIWTIVQTWIVIQLVRCTKFFFWKPPDRIISSISCEWRTSNRRLCR
jgi:hypothetical protein